MKPVAFAILMLLCSTRAHAWEFSANPDRFPSIGVNFDSGHIGGERQDVARPDNPALGLTQTDHLESSDYAAGADLRLPVSNQVTLSLSAASLWGDARLNRQANVYAENGNYSGYRFGLGARFYFNQ